MFYCPDCTAQFTKPDVIYEKHGLSSPPFEVIYTCPFCQGTAFYEKITSHCRCCGAKLKGAKSDYCSKECFEKGKKLWLMEQKRRKRIKSDPINEIIHELKEYNLMNNTNYSYGQYIAIIKPKLKAEKEKCAKKRKNI